MTNGKLVDRKGRVTTESLPDEPTARDIAKVFGGDGEQETLACHTGSMEVHRLSGGDKCLIIGSALGTGGSPKKRKDCDISNNYARQLCEEAKKIEATNAKKSVARSIAKVETFVESIGKLVQDDTDHEFYFRGHSDRRYLLRPSIYRESAWIENEHKMFRDLVLRCPGEFADLGTTLERLAKMQHYSLPTRLLDLTKNPLVALYFAAGAHSNASGKAESVDGEVVVFKIAKEDMKYYDSDTVSVISNLARMESTFDVKSIRDRYGEGISDKEYQKKFNTKEVQITRLLHEIREEKPYFRKAIVPKHIESVVAVKPKLDNPRILKQDGAFFLFGITDDKSTPAQIPDAFVCERLLIEKSGKEYIRTQLERLGLNEATLFPEIESVSEYIKDFYKP